jgi:hypothetical protein
MGIPARKFIYFFFLLVFLTRSRSCCFLIAVMISLVLLRFGVACLIVGKCQGARVVIASVQGDDDDGVGLLPGG